MSRSVVLSLIVLSLAFVHPYAEAAEGKTSDPAPVPDANRTSSYSVAPASVQPNSNQKGSKAHVNSKAVASKTTRSAPQMSGRFSDFTLYGAASTLRLDRDGDGYHSEFRIRFDADVIVDSTYVYAKLYLRRAGESQWFLYRETDDFYIAGQTSADEYYVTTSLDAGYPTGEYDVLIDLYEAGFSGIVATLGPGDSGALSYLPLEETRLDVPVGISGYSIGDVSTTLLTDADGDGHYSRFRIAFDPDADVENRNVYAKIWVRARGGEWIEEFVSEDFRVDTAGAADRYELSVDWRTGYPTAFYDVQIDLRDSATDLLVAAAGSERGALAQIPLEDQSRDQFANAPAPGGGGSTSSREGGGGAFELWSLLGLALLGLARHVRGSRTK